MFKKTGFTLTELLVSIGITILFVVVLIPSFSGFGRRNELTQAAQLVQTKIIEARSYSLAPRGVGGTNIERYEFRGPVGSAIGSCSAATTKYVILEQTEQDVQSGGDGAVVACETLPSSTLFNHPQRSIIFLVTEQGEASPSSGTITFTIQHPRLTENFRIDIVVNRATGGVTLSQPY